MYETGKLYEAQYVKNGVFVSDGIWQIISYKTKFNSESRVLVDMQIKKVADQNSCSLATRSLMYFNIGVLRKVGSETKHRLDSLSRYQFAIYFYRHKTPFVFTQINLK